MMELRFAIYSQWYLVFLSNDERFTLCQVPLLFFLFLEYIEKKLYIQRKVNPFYCINYMEEKNKKFQTIQEKSSDSV